MTVTTASTDTCTGLVARLGVERAGTAPTIRSWVLLEHPGPWGEDVRDEVFAAALPARQHQLLETLWEEQQLRPLLIRRPGRAGRRPSGAGTLLVGAAHSGRHWLERLPAAALADLDLAAVADGRGGHGEPVTGPLFAVCTNGAVDRCCAVRGRPLVAALAAAHPERTWEVTHVGGCRYGANLLVLPDGLAHGAVSAEEGLAIATAALSGRVDATRLRGRLGSGPFAGLAEVSLRRRLGLDRLADVAVLEERPHSDLVDGEDGPEPAGADVVLRAGPGVWRVVVRRRDLGPHTSVCDGTDAAVTAVVTDLAQT